MEILLSKDRIRKGIPKGSFGPCVTDLKEATQSLRRITAVAARILGPARVETGPDPRLALDERLSRLKSQTMRSFMVFAGLSLSLTAASTLAWPVGQAYIPVAGSGLSLLAIPLLVHRRTRIHLEHQCLYTVDKEGQGTIQMPQLPRIQFDSYLAHEVGHHLLRSSRYADGGTWRREGWARLFQWAVASAMAEEMDEPAYHFHVSNQTIGELKFACETICGALKRPVPKEIRSVKTIFSTNPLFCLVTGTPLTNPDEIVPHAIGTAFHFLAAQREGMENVLQEPLPVSSEPFSLASPTDGKPPAPSPSSRDRGGGGASRLIST